MNVKARSDGRSNACVCGKRMRLRKTHASDADVCRKLEKIVASCSRVNEPLIELAFH